MDCLGEYVAARRLPVKVEAVHSDCSRLTEAAFRAAIKQAVKATDQVLVLHFSLGLAREIASAERKGHAAAVAGYVEATDEVLLADANPRVYRKIWQQPVKRMFSACASLDLPGSGRSRGLMRFTLLTAAKHQGLVAAHSRGEVDRDDLFEVSTHHMVRATPAPATTWPAPPPGAHAGLAAAALALRASGHVVSGDALAAASSYPAWAVSASLRWPLVDLAAVARGYAAANGLGVAVQEVRFSSAVNDREKFRRELERGHHRPGSAYVLAFRPADAHRAPSLAKVTEDPQ